MPRRGADGGRDPCILRAVDVHDIERLPMQQGSHPFPIGEKQPQMAGSPKVEPLRDLQVSLSGPARQLSLGCGYRDAVAPAGQLGAQHDDARGLAAPPGMEIGMEDSEGFHSGQRGMLEYGFQVAQR